MTSCDHRERLLELTAHLLAYGRDKLVEADRLAPFAGGIDEAGDAVVLDSRDEPDETDTERTIDALIQRLRRGIADRGFIAVGVCFDATVAMGGVDEDPQADACGDALCAVLETHKDAVRVVQVYERTAEGSLACQEPFALQEEHRVFTDRR